jgi:hypothetical protein
MFALVNPSSNLLQLSLNEIAQTSYRIQVYDITGHTVFTGQTDAYVKETSVSLPFLQDGFYFVELSNGSHHDVKKWMVRGR